MALHSKVQKPFKILTIDGGGYRGLASLIMLKTLLASLDPEGEEGEQRPCDYFDLICGSSTGGLAALMLARLSMTVNEAIAKYKELGQIIFGEDRGRIMGVLLNGTKFDVAPFEAALKEWLPDTPLLDKDIKKHSGDDLHAHTPCFVTTIPCSLASHAEPTLLRTYRRPGFVPDNSGGHKWLIREAARATSAAATYFEPLSVNDGYRFEDAGGHGFNNPTLAALKEARSHDLFKDRIEHCVLVSLGTGLESLNKTTAQPSTSNATGIMQKTLNALRTPEHARRRIEDLISGLVAVATNTEAVNRQVCEKLTLGTDYFRFNPSRGLGDFNLADVLRGVECEQQAAAYLTEPAVQMELKACAAKLTSIIEPPPPEVRPHGHITANGYHVNFLKPVTDLISELGNKKFAAEFCDLVPRKPAPKIRGLIVVMPPANNVGHFHPSEKIIANALNTWNIDHVVLDGPSGMRTLYYAHNFLIDFPRTLMAFCGTQDEVAQAELFHTLTTRQEQLSSTTVSVVPWNNFAHVMDFLESRGSCSGNMASWAELEELSSMPKGKAVLRNDSAEDPTPPYQPRGISTPP